MSEHHQTDEAPLGEGLQLQADEPISMEELQEKLDDQGLKIRPASGNGFRPGMGEADDRSLAKPTAEAGAPIVSAARGLSARRMGAISLSGLPDHPHAKELLNKSLTARHAQRPDGLTS